LYRDMKLQLVSGGKSATTGQIGNGIRYGEVTLGYRIGGENDGLRKEDIGTVSREGQLRRRLIVTDD